MIGLRAFAASYAETLAGYLDRQDERQLRAGYELGREAVLGELSVLDLSLVHHEALAAAMQEAPETDMVVRAGEFFLEALSAYEMVRRGFQEAQEAAAVERHQADLLRQLSNFLTDAAVAHGARDSLEEVLQLVAEQARELLRAETCRVSLAVPGRGALAAIAAEPTALRPGAHLRTFREALETLDGRPVGLIEVTVAAPTSLDEALLVQLAQMASAAVERRQLYGS